MKKLILIFLLVVSIILPVYAEDASISDIKVQGLKRVDPGLVFDNIPFEVDTPISEANFSEAIQLLYKTGQFKNISIDLEGNVVVIIVNEKPIISTITFHGADAMQPDLVWIKNRTQTDNHAMIDSVRGSRFWIGSNVADQEDYNNAAYLFNFRS